MIKSNLKYLGGVMVSLLAIYGAFQLFNFSVNPDAADKEFKNYFKQDYNIYALPLPEKINLVGEEVPLKMLDVKEKLDRELLVNTYWQSNTLLYLKRSHKYFPIIEPILKENGVPDDFKYLALIESGLTNVVSPAGAEGFWQMMKSTGKQYGLEINSEVDERYNLEKATVAACKYLKEAYAKYDNWTLAAASYNMGMNGMDRRLEQQQVSSYYDLHLNDETSRYVYRILAVKQIIENYPDYGYHYRENDLWREVETKNISVDSSILNLSDFAQKQGINYHVLKQYNPWLRKNTLTNKSHKTYTLRIPKKEYLPLVTTGI